MTKRKGGGCPWTQSGLEDLKVLSGKNDGSRERVLAHWSRLDPDNVVTKEMYSLKGRTDSSGTRNMDMESVTHIQDIWTNGNVWEILLSRLEIRQQWVLSLETTKSSFNSKLVKSFSSIHVGTSVSAPKISFYCPPFHDAGISLDALKKCT